MDASTTLDWDDLRLFLAAWEHGSLTAAAQSLGLSQATMSRRLAQLEERIGHRLFDRSRTGLVATAAADTLHPHANTMAEGARQASAALQGLEAEPEGIVRLAVAPGIAVDIIPRLIVRLRVRHPKLRLEVLSDNFLRDIERHEADIALRNKAPTRGDLVWRRIADVSIGVYASPCYVATLGAQPRLNELEWVNYSPELAHILPAQFVTQQLGDRLPAYTSNSFLALRAAAQHGVGCMILPNVQGHLSGLVRVAVELPEAVTGPIFMVVHQALRRVPRVAAVMALIDETVTEILAFDRP